MKNETLILIVDDNPDNIKLLGNILYDANYNVAIANSGEKALKIANSKIPDLILLDVMMPEMSGFEVCSQLKLNPDTKDIPIIFLTALTDSKSVVTGFELGGVDYLTKPFRTEELLARVNTQLELRFKTNKLNELIETLEEKVQERTQSLVKANKKLSELDESKNYFLSLIAHELNTPINIINGFIHLLKMDNSIDEQKEYLKYIELSIDRLKIFSETAQLITSLKTKKYSLLLSTIGIADILKESLEKFMFQNKLTEFKYSVNNVDNSVLENVDVNLIKKSFSIIFENILNYAGAKSNLEIDLEQSNENLHLLFKDDGPGFQPHIIENKFNLFLSDEIMAHSTGYGLGLATIKIIMDAHGGKIDIGNNSNKGAFVKLSFVNEKI